MNSVKYDLIVEVVTERKIPIITVQKSSLGENAPRVLVLHGLRSHKERYLEDLYLFASEGLIATAIDLFSHGKREDSSGLLSSLSTDYLGAVQGIIYETVTDIRCLLNHWGIVDSTIGILGISAGGLVAHAVAVAETRIGVVVGAITSPDWTTADPRLLVAQAGSLGQTLAELSPVNHSDKYPPKAVLMLVGADDDIVSPVGSRLLVERLQPLYDQLGISERLCLIEFPSTGHTYTNEMRRLAIGWMNKHLNSTPDHEDRI